jgi:hypothetical protein
MIALTSFGVALSPGQESGNTRYSGEIMTRMQSFYQQLFEMPNQLQPAPAAEARVKGPATTNRRESEEEQLQNLIRLTQIDLASLAVLGDEPGWDPW